MKWNRQVNIARTYVKHSDPNNGPIPNTGHDPSSLKSVEFLPLPIEIFLKLSNFLAIIDKHFIEKIEHRALLKIATVLKTCTNKT
jgi:hypothetical protein